jgi:hypothetical protein
MGVELNLCVSSRARGGAYRDAEGWTMCETVRLEVCPLGLARKHHSRCPCAQVRQVGENKTEDGVRSVCATVCLYPGLPNGDQVRNAERLAAWVRRQHRPAG